MGIFGGKGVLHSFACVGSVIRNVVHVVSHVPASGSR